MLIVFQHLGNTIWNVCWFVFCFSSILEIWFGMYVDLFSVFPASWKYDLECMLICFLFFQHLGNTIWNVCSFVFCFSSILKIRFEIYVHFFPTTWKYNLECMLICFLFFQHLGNTIWNVCSFFSNNLEIQFGMYVHFFPTTWKYNLECMFIFFQQLGNTIWNVCWFVFCFSSSLEIRFGMYVHLFSVFPAPWKYDFECMFICFLFFQHLGNTIWNVCSFVFCFSSILEIWFGIYIHLFSVFPASWKYDLESRFICFLFFQHLGNMIWNVCWFDFCFSSILEIQFGMYVHLFSVFPASWKYDLECMYICFLFFQHLGNTIWNVCSFDLCVSSILEIRFGMYVHLISVFPAAWKYNLECMFICFLFFQHLGNTIWNVCSFVFCFSSILEIRLGMYVHLFSVFPASWKYDLECMFICFLFFQHLENKIWNLCSFFSNNLEIQFGMYVDLFSVFPASWKYDLECMFIFFQQLGNTIWNVCSFFPNNLEIQFGMYVHFFSTTWKYDLECMLICFLFFQHLGNTIWNVCSFDFCFSNNLEIRFGMYVHLFSVFPASWKYDLECMFICFLFFQHLENKIWNVCSFVFCFSSILEIQFGMYVHLISVFPTTWKYDLECMFICFVFPASWKYDLECMFICFLCFQHLGNKIWNVCWFVFCFSSILEIRFGMYVDLFSVFPASWKYDLECMLICFLFFQHLGNKEGEVPRCGAVSEGQRKLRVLRAGQAAAPSGGHNQPAGQGVHHTPVNQLPQAEGLRQSRGPTLAQRWTSP